MSAELMRLLSNIIRTGIISEVDEKSWRVRVRSGELETGWLRWNTTRAGAFNVWLPPSPGEQVVIACIGGNPEKWQQLQRGAASFSITLARGRAELYPEMHGTVTGFKSEIDNQDWIIAKAEHTIDNSGFTTQLELEAKIPEWIAETE